MLPSSKAFYVFAIPTSFLAGLGYNVKATNTFHIFPSVGLGASLVGYNEFINVNEIFLDCSHVAAGGIIARNTMGLTVGPSAFVTGFNVAGVQVLGGHEIMVTEAWFAECV